MNKDYIITTDSACCPLDRENMIPVSLIEDDINTYKDMIDIMPDEIMKRKEDGHVFKTANPTGEDYLSTFKKYLDDMNVVHLSMSRGVSEGSLNTSIMVANMLNDEYKNKVTVIDTLTGAAGGTLINLYANKLKDNGYSYEEIINKLNEYKKLIITKHFVKDPTGFIFSGRNKSDLLTGTLKIGVATSNKLGLKYGIDMTHDTGELGVRKLYRGSTKSKALQFMKDMVNTSNMESYEDDYFCLSSTPYEELNEDELLGYIRSLGYFKKVYGTVSSGAITSYGCYDMLSVAAKKKVLKK